AIYHVATIKHFQEGNCILQEGAECRDLYIIMNGAVRLTDIHGIYDVTLRQGDFFGEIIWKEQSRNVYSVVAVAQSTVMEINYNIVSHLSVNIQLLICKKLNHLSINTIEKLAKHKHASQTCNAQLTSYIRNMRSQTDVFITSEVFQNIIKNIPKLPKCAGSLSAKLMEDSVSAKEVTDTVQEEPALAAAILKTVNSAYYGLQEKVASLHH